MAHPTRTGDLVAFAFPPYQFDAATPGTLVAPSHFFGQHGYVPDVQTWVANANMRATFLAGGSGIAQGRVTARSIDLAPTARVPAGDPGAPAQPGQGAARRREAAAGLHAGPIVGLNDFHGQLDPTTRAFDNGLTSRSAAQPSWPRCSTRSSRTLPGPALILAGGDNVGASPPNSALLQDMPAIDVENAWGLDATSYGNHEFDYGLDAAARAAGARRLPVPGHQHRRRRRPAGPRLGDAVEGLPGQRRAGRRDRRRARGHARAGRPRAPRRG